MRILMLAFAAVAGLTSGQNAIAATAAPVSLLGITIGEPLHLPNCAVERRLHPAERATCFAESDIRLAPEMTGLDVQYLSAGSKPPFVQAVTVFTIGDRVENILILTDGAKSQSTVFEQLVEKFGKPASAEDKALQNAYGAKVSAIDAAWQVGNTRVRFQGVSNAMDAGHLSATSGKAAAKMLEAAKTRRAAEPHL